MKPRPPTQKMTPKKKKRVSHSAWATLLKMLKRPKSESISVEEIFR